jgi:hypothetical protein
VPPPAKIPAPPPSPDRQAILDVVRRASHGDATALPALRRLFQADAGLTRCLGDLAGRVRDTLLDHLAGRNLSLREAAGRELDRLRAELAGPSPTPVERMLVERVVLAWLQAHEADWRLAMACVDPAVEFLQRRSDHAQRRLLAAIKALAAVRRLARPALQVNIADRQVNVTG